MAAQRLSDLVLNPCKRALAESVAVAVSCYVIAATLEAIVIRSMRPTEWELAWVSDAVLAIALGMAVYLWRHLLTTRRELEEHERAELVLQTQLSIAADIQRRLLPDVPPPANGFEWAAALKSAGQIGGDFYDFFQVAPAVWSVLVADVSGKGIPAAMALGSLRSAFRALARQSIDPGRIVTELSTVLYEQWRGVPYVTCIVCTFDVETRMLAYANAGHPAGIVRGRNGTRYLNRGGPPAGLLPYAEFDQDMLALGAGDICLMVSDGVTESLEGEGLFDPDLIRSGAHDSAPSAKDLCQSVMARALAGRRRAGADWDDDRTVIVVTVADAGSIDGLAEDGPAILGRGAA